MHWIKEHPYLSGGLLLGLVVLFFVFKGSGSSAGAPAQASASGPSEGLQATALQTGAQVQVAQIGANAHANEINAQLAGLQISKGVELQEAQLKQQEDLQNIVTSGQVQLHTTDAALASVQAQIGGQVQLADVNANRDMTIAGIQGDVMRAGYEEATKQQGIISSAATEQTRLTAETQQQIAEYQYQTQHDIISGDVEKTRIAGDVQNYQTWAGVTAHVTDSNNARYLATDLAADQLAAFTAHEGTVQHGQDIYGDLMGHQLENQHQISDELIALVQSGQINKGGAGGANQVQLISSIFGSSPVPGATETSGGFSLNIPGVGSFGVGGSQG
jgi:hypothetical protein